MICKICGVEVYPPRKKYCSDACAYQAKQMRKLSPNPKRKPGGPVYYPRVCPDCGAEYDGHIKSVRCPSCQREMDKIHDAEFKRRKLAGHVRSIGSTDYCQSCGKPYTVEGSLQRYCKSCAPSAVRKNLREHTRDYNREKYASAEAREEKNKNRRVDWHNPRICCICGQSFVPDNPSQKACSDACKAERIRQRNRLADQKRAASRSEQNKAKYAAEKLLPPEEQQKIRDARNARARENYARRKAKNENASSESFKKPMA